MSRKPSDGAKRGILDATVALLVEHGAGGLTIDRVAQRAAVAKGLVNYHFQTKDRLLAEAVRRLAEERRTRWQSALANLDLKSAVDDTWRLIVAERDQGVLRALVSTYGETGVLLEAAVDETTVSFASVVAEGVQGLLARAGARSRVPGDQLGWLVAAVIDGVALQLASGVSPAIVENAYAAAWLGVLGLAA